MDPNANCREQCELARDILGICEWRTDSGEFPQEWQLQDIANLAEALAERVLALRDWLKAGGYFPKI